MSSVTWRLLNTRGSSDFPLAVVIHAFGVSEALMHNWNGDKYAFFLKISKLCCEYTELFVWYHFYDVSLSFLFYYTEIKEGSWCTNSFPLFWRKFPISRSPFCLMQVRLFSDLSRKKKFLSSFLNLSRRFLSAFLKRLQR